MGSLYRRGNIWWLAYSRNGKQHCESSGSKLKTDAKTLLARREGKIADGVPVTPKMGRVTYDQGAADLLNDYKVNGRRSYDVVERRLSKHLAPFFTGRKMADITTPLVRAYVVDRQRQGVVHHRTGERIGDVSNAEINRELALLKRMFSLAIKGGLLMHRPHIELLKENNVRKGFFEVEQLASVLAHLPSEVAPVIRFAAITGWRIASEVLPLEWRNVDFDAGEVRLDAGTTKNDEARVFPFTTELRALLQEREAERERLQKAGFVFPMVFFREVAEGRGGDKKPRPIIAFGKSWRSACKDAGCPGRIPHDLRRTAIRTMVRKGIPERVAMMLSGHKTRSVFERYNIVSQADLREAARKLDRRVG